ncbi:hypothetical protein TNCV_315671 [Trichonephila clavipes]|nr:hypothetical protein TNCV_315671 [Trichonephila clavipes]
MFEKLTDRGGLTVWVGIKLDCHTNLYTFARDSVSDLGLFGEGIYNSQIFSKSHPRPEKRVSERVGLITPEAHEFSCFRYKTMSHAAYCVPFVENRADMMLQNANAVLRSVHRQVWLFVALLIPRRVFETFFVWFARSLMPVLH